MGSVIHNILLNVNSQLLQCRLMLLGLFRMELFLVLSNAHFVGGPEMFAYHISIVLDRIFALQALVLFDDIAGVDR